MSFLSWTILLLSGTLAHELTDISPGVYIEEWGEAAIIEKKAEIWIRLNMSELGEEIDRMENFRLRIKTTCIKAFNTLGEQTECDSFLFVSDHMILTLREKLDKLWMEGRQRRGALNVMGTGIKFLFGTMDEDDRVNIASKLEGLQKDNLSNIKFNFEYAKLIEKAIKNVNTTIEICNRNGKLIGLVNQKIAEITYNYDVMERTSRFHHFINDLKQIFMIMNQETSDKISETHQMLIDLHNNVFNTKLIGYNEIIDSLKRLEIPEKNLELAISLSNPNFGLLRRLIKYCLVKQDEIFYLIYNLPLIDIQRLNVNKLYPIPEIHEHMATYLDLNSEFLVTNRHFDRYQTWTKNQLNENCIKFEKMYFCNNLQLLRRDKSSCEVKLMTENFKNLQKICQIKVTRIYEHLFIKTMSENTYISLSPTDETGSLVTGKSVKSIKFKGAQLLAVRADALLSLDAIQIKFYNSTSVAVVRQVNLTSTFEFTIKDPIWNEIALPTFDQPRIIDNKEFLETGMELEAIKIKAKKIIDSNKKESKNDWLIYIIIAIVALIALAGAAVVVVMRRKTGGTEEETREDIGLPRMPGSSNSLPAL